MSDQEATQSPLDEETTVELIDTLMRKPPLELDEGEIERIVDRLHQHRKNWEAKSSKGSRQTGGVKRKTAKKKTGKADAAKVAELEDLLGDLDV